jgi:hypothetical protein
MSMKVQHDSNGHPDSDVPFPSRIPLDIWREVFRCCLPDDKFLKPSPTTAPLLLCGICRDWRAVALSMGDLWSFLSIKVTNQGITPENHLISTWLDRAIPHPLSISLTLHGRPGDNAYMNVELALHGFLTYFRFWKQIVINVGPFLHLDSLLQLQPSEDSFLEDLDLFLPTSFQEASQSLDHIFQHSPLLRRLTLTTDLREQDHVPMLSLPFSGLTSLHLRSSMFSMDNCRELLQQCPKLVEFKYQTMWGGFQRIHNDLPIVLPDLQTLSLISTSREMNVFFDSFTFPSLSALQLVAPYPFPTHAFLTLLRRSSCSLLSLSLAVSMTDGDLIKCLLSCATLSVLSLNSTAPDEPFVTDSVLKLLTVESSGAIRACPRLKSIEIGAFVTSSTDGLLATMLQSRYTNGDSSEMVCLTEATISVPESNMDDLLQLTEMQQPGLTVNMHEV